jgi:DNA polymerase III delta subunit
MLYTLIGDQIQAKEKKIDEIKKSFLTSGNNFFDHETLYGTKLNSYELKKSLLNLPALASKRVITIKTSQKLDSQNQDIILNFIKTNPKYLVLILDFDGNEETQSFYKKIQGQGESFKFISPPKANVFDMTRAIEQKNLVGAFKILHELFEAGQHPLQIMGGVVWFWGKQKQRLSQDRFGQGLEALQEADLNIKRSRINPEQAIEVLVTKLSGLITG